jgi:NitT/TauT family transport system substrate-binding protein
VLSLAAACSSPSTDTAGSSTGNTSASDTSAPKPLSPPVTVQFAVDGLATEAGIFIAQSKGYFQQEGINLQLQTISSLSTSIPLLATGKLDFATGGVVPALFNAVNSGIGLKIVAANAVGVKGSAPAALVVRSDLVNNGTYKDLSSLKGMTIAVNELGSSSEFLVDKMLAKVHLKQTDVKFVPLSFPNMSAALKNGSIDAAFAVEPFVSLIVKAGIGKSVSVADQVFPGNINQAIVISPLFAKANPAAANRVMYAFLKGQGEFLNAFITGKNKGNQAAIIDILTKYTVITNPATFQGMGESGGNFNGEFSIPAMKALEDYYLQQGTMTKGVSPLTKMVDFSYVQWASTRLGITETVAGS